ncbi:post-GPI attachment to proteins factor 2 [Folsomia candida]|uniref:Post-GPI attachment to proteins factor 2 n=1 Tax=Folsomia candida TaxID=158441 RepID=A0A226EYG8_FOLCA|nr:post-GPI attachment to proteins factor 2 [Folsomia candida]OXA62655.1 Post-GPI attachment to proteins factor 2 [Folsomia candida]
MSKYSKSWFDYKRLSDASTSLDGVDFNSTTIGSNKDLLQRCSVIRVPFRNLARATVSLPLGGFIFIVIWAMLTDLEAATYTHCGVRNYLPSLSAAMGGFSLSQTVWRVCIALHAAPRFIVTGMYYRYLKSIVFGRHVIWAATACLLNVLENLGLIGLTYVSSKENYRIHEKCFIIFMVCSELYMVIMCLLLHRCRNIPATLLESKSLRVKVTLVLVNLVSFALAGYTFVRHNAYCEEGMYTLFAFLEYIVILTNMGFHMTAFWDFYDKVITIDLCNLNRLRTTLNLNLPY